MREHGMGKGRPWRWPAVGVAVLGLLGGTAAGPAQAAVRPHLTVLMSCAPQGHSIVACSASPDGGSAPWTAHWTISAMQITTTTLTVFARCLPGFQQTAFVSLVDHNGDSGSSGTIPFKCLAGPPP
jgi:hypothetical protein